MSQNAQKKEEEGSTTVGTMGPKLPPHFCTKKIIPDT